MNKYTDTNIHTYAHIQKKKKTLITIFYIILRADQTCTTNNSGEFEIIMYFDSSKKECIREKLKTCMNETKNNIIMLVLVTVSSLFSLIWTTLILNNKYIFKGHLFWKIFFSYSCIGIIFCIYNFIMKIKIFITSKEQNENKLIIKKTLNRFF